MFSPAGLRRLCDRAGWDVCDIGFLGNTAFSDPVSPEGDERAYCVLRSRAIGSFDPAVTLLDGWHEPVEEHWRWTEKEFSIGIRNHGTVDALEINISFWMPEHAKQQLGQIQLSAWIDGSAAPSETFSTPGHNRYTVTIPTPNNFTVLRVSVDKSYVPGGADPRELGLAVDRIEVR
jgi:hypothetical protein